MPNARVSILLCGELSTRHYGALREIISAECPLADLRAITTAQAADVAAADLIIISQTWSDEFTHDDVARLVSQAGSARLICCYGPWCASDGRTRSTWPLSVRVPQPEFRDRLRGELVVLGGTAQPLPLTADRDEIFAASSGSIVGALRAQAGSMHS
jgi:hypothetical protein